MKLNHKIKETLQSLKRIFLFRKYKTKESSSKQNSVTLSSSKCTTWRESFRKGLMMGFGIMLGMFGTGVMAVAVTGTMHKFLLSNPNSIRFSLNSKQK